MWLLDICNESILKIMQIELAAIGKREWQYYNTPPFQTNQVEYDLDIFNLINLIYLAFYYY